MYRYLDRPVAALEESDRFLLSSMRTWVGAAQTGRCDCRQLQDTFRGRGMEDALQDFGILMATLNHEGLGRLRFGARCETRVTDDEARLLSLFATAHGGPLTRLKRAAATLVAERAVARLAQATDYVSTALAGSNPANAK